MPRRGHGEGGIYQRHDHPSCPTRNPDGSWPRHTCRGRWAGALNLGWSGGKRQRKVVYARTRKEVTRKLAQLQREHLIGSVVGNTVTVESWLRYWLDHIVPETARPATVAAYSSKARTHIVPTLGRHRLDRLEPAHVRELYARMRAGGSAEGTVRLTRAVLSMALEAAVREGKVTRNVAKLTAPPKQLSVDRTPLTADQARRVLAAAEGTAAEARWYAALYLGLRQGEALALRWSDVDLDNGWLAVRRSLRRDRDGGGLVFAAPKSRHSERVVPLPTVVRSRLTVAWAAHVNAGGAPDGLVWPRPDGRPVDPRADWQAWRDLLAAAGVPHVPLHAARNTAASLLEAAGVPDRMVMQILGHSSVHITHGYQTADVERLRGAMLALEAHVTAP